MVNWDMSVDSYYTVSDVKYLIISRPKPISYPQLNLIRVLNTSGQHWISMMTSQIVYL